MSTQDTMQDAMVTAMGVELGRTFFALYNKIVWLHAVWQEYRVLYGTSEEKLQIANRAAGFFFKIVQDELWDSVLLRIARLTDPVKTAGKENLSVQRLPELIEDPSLSTEVRELVSTALKKSTFAREHRHKRLAHNDFAHSMDASVPLSGISRRYVEDALEALRNVMNKIDGHYRETTVMYEEFIASSGAQRLLFMLQRAESQSVAR